MFAASWSILANGCRKSRKLFERVEAIDVVLYVDVQNVNATS
jgi:hypothetical protein